MKTLVAAAARHPVISNLLMAVFLVGGAWGFTHMRAEVFPDVSIDLALVTYPYPGASASEVEQGLVLKLEEALEGLEGIDDVVSIAREGVATLQVELEEMDPGARREVLDEIKDRIDAIQGLPDSVEEPTVREPMIQLPAALLVLHGPADERPLRELAYRIKDDLRARGIAQVHLTGLRDYEISIEVDEEALRAHELSLSDVSKVVRAASLDLPAGSIRTRDEQLSIEIRGLRRTGREYRDLVVQSLPNGTVVRLGQLAKVIDGFEEQEVLGRYGGQRACLIQVNTADGDDTIEVAAAVVAYAKEVLRDLPEGMELVVLGDFSRDIVDRINLLLGNGWMGLLLVFACLVLMLNLRLSLWVAAGIPVAFACAGVVVWGAGHSINMINLFGLILVLGIVVDDAIVVGENVFAHQEAGASPMEAAIAGASEVSWPVLAGITTTIVAFTPLFFVDGVMGKFIAQMPLIVIATLIGSLIESLFILPHHLAHVSLKKAEVEPGQETSSMRMRARLDAAFQFVVQRIYRPLYGLALEHRATTLALAFASLVGCAGLIAGDVLAFVMLPKEDSVYVQVDVTYRAGTPFEATVEAVRRVEAATKIVDQKLSKDGKGPFVGVYAIAGLGGQENVGRVVIALRPSEERTLHSEAVLAALRAETGPFPNALSVSYGQFGGVWSKDVEFKVRGQDPDRVRDAASELVTALERVPGTLDTSSDYLPGKREFRVRLTELGRIQGITVTSLARQVRGAFYGDEAVAIQRGRDEVEVQVRFPRDARASRGALTRMWIRGPQGATFPFVEVAEAELVQGLAEIRRRDGQREVTVTAAVNEDATTASRVVAALEEGDLAALLARNPEITIEIKGAAAESAKTVDSLAFGFGAAGIAMFAILALAFRSYLQPLLIMAVIPFGFVGAVLAHLAAGLPFTMLSVFGLVALAGVVVNDSLVLIDRINGYLREGAGLVEALERAGPSRFRPILLTTVTTVAGLFPILFEQSFQAQFIIPMAVSLSGGLLAATLGTLFIVPALYLVLNDLRRLAFHVTHGRWPEREEVEPGCQEAVARRAEEAEPVVEAPQELVEAEASP
ncbi:MAG: efflux RND transporter permease subunit [Planctomycetes bacterium]|nr:efflux RND transporter permease subunit [Planctomycetota bacterium]